MAPNERELGEISTALEYLKEGQRTIFKKMDELVQITTAGATLQKEHDRQIKDLQSRPAKFLVWVASIVSLAGAIISWLGFRGH